MRKIIALTLSLIVFLSIFSGCKKEEETIYYGDAEEEGIVVNVGYGADETYNEGAIVAANDYNNTYEIDPQSANIDIGWVVLLKGASQPLLIVTKNYVSQMGATYEYLAFPYPTGTYDGKEYIGFNKYDIEKIVSAPNIVGEYTSIPISEYDTFGGKYVTTELSEAEKAELNRVSASYSAYQRIDFGDNVFIGIPNVTFYSRENQDIFIFDVVIENLSDSQIIINGRMDFSLDINGRQVEPNDGLISADQIVNFRIEPRSIKSGKIAYEVPINSGDQLKLTMNSNYIAERHFYVAKRTN